MYRGEARFGMRRPVRPALWIGGAIVLVIAIVVPVAVFGGSRSSILIIGDSLTYQSSSALQADLGAKGFSTHVEAVPGSGLLDTVTNWNLRAQQLIAADKPDEVVVEFIGNYGLLGAQPGIADGTPQFYDQWRNAAQDLEDVLTARHAQVYWVIGPPLASPVNQAKLTTLDRIYESLHAPTTSGTPPLIDVSKAFSAPTGGFAEYLPEPDGTPVQMRLPDGIHFTLAGIARYAGTVAQSL